MKKCPKCEINWITDDSFDLCDVCEQQKVSKGKSIDNNKNDVEQNLIPILQKLSFQQLNRLTQKDDSFRIFGLRFPLLVKCNNIDKEHCRKEIITDKSKTYRYYIEPYDINGEFYHICSQWSNTYNEKSKAILQLLQEIT